MDLNNLSNLNIGGPKKRRVFKFLSYKINISELRLNPHLFKILFFSFRIINSTLKIVQICIVQKLVSNVAYDRTISCDILCLYLIFILSGLLLCVY